MLTSPAAEARFRAVGSGMEAGQSSLAEPGRFRGVSTETDET